MNKKQLLKSFQAIFMLIAVSTAFFSCAHKQISEDELKIPFDMDFSEDYKPVELEITADKSEYKILQLADIQLAQPSGNKQTKTFELAKKVIEEANPDLIVLTGDNTAGDKGREVLDKLIPFLDSFNIPYAPVFGNHDAEGGDREILAEYYLKGENCLFKIGPKNIHGVGNYQINIRQNNEVKYSFYMIDSNRYRQYSVKDRLNSDFGAKGSYDFIYPDQIAWYAFNVNKTNELANKLVKSLAFFHIAIPEFRAYKDAAEEDIIIPQDGNGEPPCNSYINTGLFNVMKELGSTQGAFVGHDHINDYVFKYQGIILGYGLKCGRTSYYDEALQGGTVITLKNNFTDIEVKHIYEKDLQ